MDETTQPELLTRRHQLTVAVIVSLSMAVLATSTVVGRIRHGQQINIDRAYELPQVQLQIDLNEAAWPELTLLPEISGTMAQRIVEYRERSGNFRVLADVQQVKGIGPRTFARIRPYLKSIVTLQSNADMTAGRE